MIPNNLDRFKVKNTNMHVTYNPEAQIFVRFALYNEPYLSYSPILEKCTEWPQMTLIDMFNFKNTNIHVTYTHEAQIFVCFALWWAVFELLPVFAKVHQMTPNDLDMFQVKNTNMHVTYTPGDQIFIRFIPRWAVFELRLNFWKSALNDPKWPWQV